MRWKMPEVEVGVGTEIFGVQPGTRNECDLEERGMEMGPLKNVFARKERSSEVKEPKKSGKCKNAGGQG